MLRSVARYQACLCSLFIIQAKGLCEGFVFTGSPSCSQRVIPYCMLCTLLCPWLERIRAAIALRAPVWQAMITFRSAGISCIRLWNLLMGTLSTSDTSNAFRSISPDSRTSTSNAPFLIIDNAVAGVTSLTLFSFDIVTIVIKCFKNKLLEPACA